MDELGQRLTCHRDLTAESDLRTFGCYSICRTSIETLLLPLHSLGRYLRCQRLHSPCRLSSKDARRPLWSGRDEGEKFPPKVQEVVVDARDLWVFCPSALLRRHGSNHWRLDCKLNLNCASCPFSHPGLSGYVHSGISKWRDIVRLYRHWILGR